MCRCANVQMCRCADVQMWGWPALCLPKGANGGMACPEPMSWACRSMPKGADVQMCRCGDGLPWACRRVQMWEWPALSPCAEPVEVFRRVKMLVRSGSSEHSEWWCWHEVAGPKMKAAGFARYWACFSVKSRSSWEEGSKVDVWVLVFNLIALG